MSYLGRSAKLSLKAQEKVSFLATAGQTVKTGLSYVPSFVEVYVNGILLTDTTDFTAVNGSSITFTVALALNDEVTVISLKTFSVSDHYTKTEDDALLAAKAPLASPSFTGDVSATGMLSAAANQGHRSANGANSASRSWVARNDLAAFGDWGVQQSTTQAGTSYATKLIIDPTGNTTVSTGNLVIGTSGKGLAVGGTGAANTLDDYEEGTWSMVIKGSTGSTGSWAQAGVQASYTKIGRVVHFTGTGYVSNKGSYSGGLQVQGLPFASGNTNGNTAVSASSIPVAAFGNAVYIPQVQANSSACQIRKGTYLDAAAQWSELVVNIRFNISGFYTTA